MFAKTKRSKYTHINENNIDAIVDMEIQAGETKFGKYNSAHEAYGVIKEEFEEWWDSVKANDEDPKELIQLIATAKRELIHVTNLAREEQVRCEICQINVTYSTGTMTAADKIRACKDCLGLK